MNAFETFLLGIGFSWTWSKLFIYIALPVAGLLVWLFLRKRISQRWVSGVLLGLLIVLPFGLYFILYPIYEGDFSNHSEKVNVPAELEAKQAAKLVVITIPGCPFCMASIRRMKDFKQRNPSARIEYRVCSSHPEDLKAYQVAAGGAFPIVLAKDMHQLADVSGYAFPSFVLVDGSSAVKWSNDHFGVAALDEVEERFQ